MITIVMIVTIAATFTVESDTCEHCQSGAAQGRGWDSLPHWHL